MTSDSQKDEVLPRAGVIGWPVQHSRSPKMHGFWLAKYGLPGRYDKLPVPPEDLAAFLSALKTSMASEGFRGVNVTLPHKVAAMEYLDEITPLARRIGAVNTITVRADGTLLGDNTDIFGFLENIREAHPEWRASSGPAVLLGAGGGARAALVGLLDQGAPEIRLLNRTLEKAEALAEEFGDRVTPLAWDRAAEALEGAALLANTTSLGMMGQPPLDLELNALPQAAIVADIVYSPLETDLLRRAAQRGHRVVEGLDMLLHQGRPAFEAFFGLRPDVTPALREAVLAP